MGKTQISRLLVGLSIFVPIGFRFLEHNGDNKNLPFPMVFAISKFSKLNDF